MAEDLGDLANLKDMLPAARPAGFAGVPLINMYSYVYVMAYRDAAFPDGKPDSWSVLLDPKFKGRIALYDDGIGFHPVARDHGRRHDGRHPGQHAAGLGFHRQAEGAGAAAGRGPRLHDLVPERRDRRRLHDPEQRARGQDRTASPCRGPCPKEGAKVDTDGMWIPKGLPANELHWAKEYVNFAMSQNAQQVWTDGLGLPGLWPGLTPPADLVGDPAYPTTPADFAKLLSVPTPVLVEHEAEWFQKFNEIMQG